MTQASASRIVFEGKCAVGVEYTDHGKHLSAKAVKEVILCAGALETPKLLMLSGVGPKAHLAEHGIVCVHDLPGIGENLHDHPNVCMFLTGKQPIDFGYPQVYGFDRMNPELESARGAARYLYCYAFGSNHATAIYVSYGSSNATPAQTI